MTDSIWTKLAAPLDPRVIKTREQAGKVLRYIDSRTVTDILDAHVLGDWTLKMFNLPARDEINRKTGEVIGPVYTMQASLTVNGVTREDVGEGDDYKAAASDALKRAAVRFGIGRELYGEKPGDAPARAATTTPNATEKRAATVAEIKTLAAEVGEVVCPVCAGPMWDDRLAKTNPKAPDYKCKNKPKTRGGEGCPGVIWPPKAQKAPAVAAAPANETEGEWVSRLTADVDGEEIPF